MRWGSDHVRNGETVSESENAVSKQSAETTDVASAPGLKQKLIGIGAVALVVVALVVAGSVLGDSKGDDGTAAKGTAPQGRESKGERNPGDPSDTRSEATSTAAEYQKRVASATPEPVTKPTALTGVKVPPDRTVAFIDAARYSADTTYTVQFTPYGMGPGGDSLVVRITSSKPVGMVDRPFEFEGRNAILSMARLDSKDRIATGGKYSGEIRLVEQQGMLAPFLVSVKARK